MYVIGTDACDLPNSETPMSQAAIDQEDAFLSSVGSAFDGGDAALNGLITQLGGNPGGATASGASGIPTTGTLDISSPGVPVVPDSQAPAAALLPDVTNPASWAWAPSPPQIVPGGGAGGRSSGRTRRYVNSGTKTSNAAPRWGSGGPPPGCPTIIPLVTTIPLPSDVPTAPQPVAIAVPVPTQTAPPPAPAAPLPDCRTGNWCLDIRNGCVLPSQVTPQQVQICSQAGYVGARSLYPAIAAAGGAGGGAFFGTPDPNPIPYNPAGMSGLGQDDAASVQAANSSIFSSAIESVITGLVAAAALGVILKGRKKG
jgi:hypothetical protein